MAESDSSSATIGAPALTTPSISTSTVTQAPVDDKDRDLESLGEFKYFRAPTAGPSSEPSGTGEIPKEFFEHTAADLRVSQAALIARSKALQDAPLMTQKIRDQKEKERLNRWPTATIRIRFSDRSQIEKKFRSDEKIRAVYAFVRGCLRGDIIHHKFVLYQTPPPRDLKVSDPAIRDKTLLGLSLAPSSILMFRFLDETLSLDSPHLPPPLLDQILTRAMDLPPPPTFDGESRSSEPSRSRKPQTATSGGGSGSGDKKVPKWLKLGSEEIKV